MLGRYRGASGTSGSDAEAVHPQCSAQRPRLQRETPRGCGTTSRKAEAISATQCSSEKAGRSRSRAIANSHCPSCVLQRSLARPLSFVRGVGIITASWQCHQLWILCQTQYHASDVARISLGARVLIASVELCRERLRWSGRFPRALQCCSVCSLRPSTTCAVVRAAAVVLTMQPGRTLLRVCSPPSSTPCSSRRCTRRAQ